MEQRDPPRSESRRRRLVDDEKWREETFHVRVVPPAEMPQHRPRIPNGSSTPTIHRSESARDTLHELYQANGVVQGRPVDGERQASSRTEHGGQRCNTRLPRLERHLG